MKVCSKLLRGEERGWRGGEERGRRGDGEGVERGEERGWRGGGEGGGEGGHVTEQIMLVQVFYVQLFVRIYNVTK